MSTEICSISLEKNVWTIWLQWNDIKESLPIGLGMAQMLMQSKGRFPWDQIIGWTFCWIFREMATILHVSFLTAVLLDVQTINIHKCQLSLQKYSTISKLVSFLLLLLCQVSDLQQMASTTLQFFISCVSFCIYY